MAFWEAFLDMMADNRFNALTLWNMHPWPYMIRATNFPLATPVQLADELEQNANQALGLVEGLTSGNLTLACETTDVEMWAHFGLYFATKIRAGIAQETGDVASRDALMTEAVTHWEQMVALNATHNHEQIPDMQNGTFSWNDLLTQVRAEAP